MKGITVHKRRVKAWFAGCLRLHYRLMNLPCRVLCIALLFACSFPTLNPGEAMAQSAQESEDTKKRREQSLNNENLLLDADSLTYNTNKEVVTITGNVQIFFDGNSLEADEVEYNRAEGQLMARGNVRLIDLDGNVLRSEEIKLSEDFKEAFIASLQIDGFDDTFFAASSATRTNGTRTVLKKGIYNVCGACRTKPGRIPTWRIKAEEIIISEETEYVIYKDATFEILGVPVAYLPRFAHVDPRVKQKAGILPPKLDVDNDLGLGFGVPVYYAFSKSSDLTITPTGFTKQGLLGEIEYRNRRANGAYSFQLAGIDQQGRDEFRGETGDRSFRGGLRTTGDFAINNEWDAGWDILALTDRAFAEDYDRLTDRVDRFSSNAYLTGVSRTKYFDVRGFYFNILDEDTATSGNLQNQQAIVHPSIDYDGIVEKAIAGGQVSFRSNLTALSRTDEELTTINGNTFLDGASGTQGRLSGEVEWKRQVITRGGHIITPSVAFRGDGQAYNRNDTAFNGVSNDDVVFRGQVTGGLEWRYPVLISNGATSHIIEPIAQLFVSPNEQQADEFLNEDSQSILLDDTNIFQRDRFSGFDRVEGGTRANIGLTYQGQLTSWLTTDALIGQSFHIAGENSFENQGTASVYVENGLESNRSDIVTRFGVTAIDVLNLTSRTRFDEDNLEINRADIIASYVGNNIQTSFGYTLLREQEIDGLERSSQIFGEFAMRPHEYVTFFGDGRYDLNDSRFVNNRLGVAYDDKQLRVSLAFRSDFDVNGDRDGEGIELRVNLRTLGGF